MRLWVALIGFYISFLAGGYSFLKMSEYKCEDARLSARENSNIAVDFQRQNCEGKCSKAHAAALESSIKDTARDIDMFYRMKLAAQKK